MAQVNESRYFTHTCTFVAWLVKVLLFLPADGDGKLYDAYVVYPQVQGDMLNEAVEAFALKTLPQVLEGRYGYRLFILGRDSLPGQGKMVYSIQNMYTHEHNSLRALYIKPALQIHKQIQNGTNVMRY